MIHHSVKFIGEDSFEAKQIVSPSGDINTVFTLTPKKFNTLLRQTRDPKFHWKTSCCAYIFQQVGLVEPYQEVVRARKLSEEPEKLTPLETLIDKIHEFSSLFISLDELINNPPPGSSLDSLSALNTALDNFLNKFNACAKGYPEFQRLETEKIIPRITRFKKRIKKLQKKQPPPTQQEVSHIFKLRYSDFSGNDSLGLVSAKCMINVIQTSRELAYATNQTYIKEAIHVSSLVGSLSDAEKFIRKKMLSISGTEHIAEAKVPSTMIAALTRSDAEIAEIESAHPNQRKQFHAQYYLNDKSNIAELETLAYVAHHGHRPEKTQHLYSTFDSMRVYAASVVEFIYSMVPFVLAHIFLSPAILVGRLIFGPPKDSEKKGFLTRFSQYISEKFSHNSITGTEKLNIRKKYVEKQADYQLSVTADDSSSRDNLTEQPRSLFTKLWESHSPDQTADSIYKVVTTLHFGPWEGVKQMGGYLFGVGTHGETPEDIYRKVIERTKAQRNTLATAVGDIVKGVNNGSASTPPISLLQPLSSAADVELIDILPPQPAQSANIQSPMGLLKLGVEASLDSIDNALRKAPFPATLPSAASFLTIGASLAPGFAIPILQTLLLHVPEKLSTFFFLQTSMVEIHRAIGSAVELLISTNMAELIAKHVTQQSNSQIPTDWKNHEQTVMALYIAAAVILIAQYMPIVPETSSVGGQHFNDPYADVFDIILQNLQDHNTIMAGDIATLVAAVRFGSQALSKERKKEKEATLEETPHAEHPLTEQEAKGTLNEALNLIKYIQFESTAEALKFYHHLEVLFDEYNKTQQHHPERQIDPTPVLHNFYNEHCRRWSLFAIRLLYVFPLPIVYVWRIPKFFFAVATNDRVMLEQLRKSVNKDIIIVVGPILSMLSTLTTTALRIASYVTRLAIDSLLLPTSALAGLLYGGPKSSYEFAVNTGLFVNRWVAFHRPIPGTRWFFEGVRSFFSSAAAVADTSHNLSECIKDTQKRLNHEYMASDPHELPTMPPAETQKKNWIKRAGQCGQCVFSMFSMLFKTAPSANGSYQPVSQSAENSTNPPPP